MQESIGALETKLDRAVGVGGMKRSKGATQPTGGPGSNALKRRPHGTASKSARTPPDHARTASARSPRWRQLTRWRAGPRGISSAMEALSVEDMRHIASQRWCNRFF